jgi:hypothetical protein
MTRRLTRGRIAAIVAAIALVAGPLVVLNTAAEQPAAAADLSSFDAGFIISDEVFYNSNTMTKSQIQSFLEARDPGCKDYYLNDAAHTKMMCIQSYSAKVTARAASDNCSAIKADSSATAAEIIYTVTRACGVNPQVILVLLQKEEDLINNAHSKERYKIATGYGCPDTAACATKYFGFYNQVWNASNSFKQWGKPLTRKYMPGRYNTIKYHPNSSCGTASIYIKNLATAALYTYTPYVPNSAALGAGYGYGNSCSSYGNRNFYNYFTDWFGNPANLLSGGSFDGSKLTGWGQYGGSSNIALKKNDARAQSGTGLLATSTATAGRSIGKYVHRSVKPGQTYEATIWVRTGVDTDLTTTGTLKLSARGGTTESVTADFAVQSTWQQVTVTLDVEKSSHSSLLIQVYQTTPSQTLFIDSASIAFLGSTPSRAPVTLKNASFEASSSGWKRGSGNAVSIARTTQTDAAPAQDGTHYLKVATSKPTSSVIQDVKRSIVAGDSFTVTAWVRSASLTRTMRGSLKIAGIGGASEVTTLPFTVGSEWTKLSATVDMKKSHTTLRTAFYLYTGHLPLLIDNVSIVPNLLTNSSFETGAPTGWFESSGGEYTSNVVSDITQAPDGSKYIQLTRVGTTGTKFTQDVLRKLKVGETYTVGGWFRSSSPDTAYTSVLRLIARGGVDPAEYDAVTFDVGTEWTYIEVSHTVTTPQETLRVDIQVSSMPFALEVDGLNVR